MTVREETTVRAKMVRVETTVRAETVRTETMVRAETVRTEMVRTETSGCARLKELEILFPTVTYFLIFPFTKLI